MNFIWHGGIGDVIQFGEFYCFFPNRGIAVFCNAQENQVSMAAGSKLFLLYVLECKICAAAFLFDSRYIYQRPAD